MSKDIGRTNEGSIGVDRVVEDLNSFLAEDTFGRETFPRKDLRCIVGGGLVVGTGGADIGWYWSLVS